MIFRKYKNAFPIIITLLYLNNCLFKMFYCKIRIKLKKNWKKNYEKYLLFSSYLTKNNMLKK